MKIILLMLIIAGLTGFTMIPHVIDVVYALCLMDSDWPAAPCYGRPSDNPGIEQLKKDWEGYYQYKGEKWMEEQKAILMDFVNQGRLSSYLYHKSEFYTNSNYNVWKYYYLQGEVPQTNGKYLGEFDYPYQQYFEKFFEHSYLGVQCNTGLVLAVKNTNQMPVCVKESTGKSLIQRGWGNFVKTVNVEKTKPSILYDIRGGKLTHVTPKFDSFGNVTSIEFSLAPNDDGLFSARIPSDLFNTNPDYWREFVIKVDGVVTETEYWVSSHEYKLFSVPFTNNTSIIEASLPVK